jgi:hypothetical protein
MLTHSVSPPQFLGGDLDSSERRERAPYTDHRNYLLCVGKQFIVPFFFTLPVPFHHLLLRRLQYRCDRVVNNLVTNTEDPGLKSRPGDRLLLGFSWCYSVLQAAAQIVSRISEDRFIQLPLHFTALSFGSV